MKRLIVATISSLFIFGCSSSNDFQAVLQDNILTQSVSKTNIARRDLSTPDFVSLFPAPVKGNSYLYQGWRGSGSENGSSIGLDYKIKIDITSVQGNKVSASITKIPVNPSRSGSDNDNTTTWTVSDSPDKFWKTLVMDIFSNYLKPISNVSFTTCQNKEDCPPADVEVPAGTFKANNISTTYRAKVEVGYQGSPPDMTPILRDGDVTVSLDISHDAGIVQLSGESRVEFDNDIHFEDLDLKLTGFKRVK
jgi:hypothetical protein